MLSPVVAPGFGVRIYDGNQAVVGAIFFGWAQPKRVRILRRYLRGARCRDACLVPISPKFRAAFLLILFRCGCREMHRLRQ